MASARTVLRIKCAPVFNIILGEWGVAFNSFLDLMRTVSSSSSSFFFFFFNKKKAKKNEFLFSGSWQATDMTSIILPIKTTSQQMNPIMMWGGIMKKKKNQWLHYLKPKELLSESKRFVTFHAYEKIDNNSIYCLMEPWRFPLSMLLRDIFCLFTYLITN